MKVESMPDFYPPLDVVHRSREELERYIRQLEKARSIWDSRIRVCEEREFMYKTMVNDMAALLAVTFQQGHEAVSENAAKATEMIEAIQNCMKKLEV
jgi:hypothetical protein